MASKKTGRLAGLAALAGAAYLADKKGMFGGKGKDAKADRDDADRYTGSRAPAAEAAKPKRSVDLGEIRDEAGTLSKFRRNTETGELYDPGDDGGKSMIDRQNAAAKRAGLNVNDYYASGKAAVDKQDENFKRGGKVKKMASGGMTSSASKRGDGIASKGKTRCKMY